MVLVHVLLMAVSVPVSLALYTLFAFVAGFFVSTRKRSNGATRKSKPKSDDDATAVTPLRVGFIHPDFGIGGAENLVVNAMLALQRKRVHVTMFTAHHDPTHCFEETRGDGPLAPHIHVYGDWLPTTIGGRLYAACAYVRVLYVTLIVGLQYARDLDVVFVDQVSIAIPLLRYFGVPVLFYGHYPDKLLSLHSNSLLARIYRWPLDTLEEVTTAAADRIVVNSKFTRSVFQQSFPRLVRCHADLAVLYPPVDVHAFETAVANATGPARNATLFVSLNRFERKKNVALAIRALACLKQRIPAATFAAVRLVIAGGYDPRNDENIAHLVELQAEVTKYALEPNVAFQTSVSDAMKKELLATATAIVYTPSNEHFGIVPVEAMASSTPVIAVNSGGPCESIVDNETGFLCASTPDAFAVAMAKLCLETDGPKRVQAMGACGQERARALFSLETFADALFAHVEELAH